jgi:polysaccharide deacetylase 2 family uncharacterized protein YibQ
MNWFGSQHFINNEELMENIKTWVSSQVAYFFDAGTQYDKCLNSGSDYVEK